MTPIIEAKCAALAEYKCSPAERNLEILRAARNRVQQTPRYCANKCWMQLIEDIQTAVITGNTRGQDMRDAKIVTLHKNKGDRNDCHKYSGISLLSILSDMSAEAG